MLAEPPSTHDTVRNPEIAGAPRSAFWYVGLGVIRSCFSLLIQKKKKAGILGSGLEQLRLVAGVRFELTTFGL